MDNCENLNYGIHNPINATLFEWENYSVVTENVLIHGTCMLKYFGEQWRYVYSYSSNRSEKWRICTL